EEDSCTNIGIEQRAGQFKKLLLFSRNDYLGLSSHPTIGKAAAKACLTTAFFVLQAFQPIWLSSCSLKKKVIVTYSMDGDFAPMAELVNLGKKHGFLLTIDDAHGTFVCGKDGGGVAQEINCARDFDICVGTLSKAAGCHGGFIACRYYKLSSIHDSFLLQLLHAHAAVIVAEKEAWRMKGIWKRVQDFPVLTGILIISPIISFIVGSEEKDLRASCQCLPPSAPPLCVLGCAWVIMSSCNATACNCASCCESGTCWNLDFTSLSSGPLLCLPTHAGFISSSNSLRYLSRVTLSATHTVGERFEEINGCTLRASTTT
ncbi:unnamed protein product, partial [Linum tenue]